MRTRHLPLVVPATAALAIALAIALALGGCGGKGKHNGVATARGKAKTSATPSSGDVAEQMRKFAACMREHGVDLPDPKVVERGKDEPGSGMVIESQEAGAPPADEEKVKAAQKACNKYLPNGGDMPKPDAAQMEGMRKFAKCMRDNGIENFPDPSDTGGIDIGSESGIDPRDPKFQDAQKKCEQNLPKPPSGGAVRQGGPGGGGVGGGGK